MIEKWKNQTVTFVRCDECKKRGPTALSEEDPTDLSIDDGWVYVGGKHICPNCDCNEPTLEELQATECARIQTRIRETAYNAHPDCADYIAPYGRGIVVGQISTIMALNDLRFEQAVAWFALQINKKPLALDCVPDSWRDEFRKVGLL